jgi:hypothetical protein
MLPSYIFTKCHYDHNCFSVQHSWFEKEEQNIGDASYTSWMPKYNGFGHCTNGTWACTIIDFYNCANFDMPGPSLTDGQDNTARFTILYIVVLKYCNHEYLLKIFDFLNLRFSFGSPFQNQKHWMYL